MYRSGDMGRYLANGDIEYLGRIDDQVKVRGFRIELGEIEGVLSEHVEVQEAVVMAREDGSGEKRLIAYVVLKNENAQAVGELKTFLKKKLPDYMVPSAFVLMTALPLTTNGKVDKRALPLPDASRPQIEESFVAPGNAIEEALARYWREVLGLAEVGIQDNLFELGGDSILAIQIVAKANQEGLRITPKDLFQHQTIAELSLAIEKAGVIHAEQGIVTGAFPLTPVQCWFFEQDLPEPHHWNQAVLLETTQQLDASILEAVIGRLLDHHDALRLRFENEDGQWHQVNAPDDSHLPFTLIDLSGVPQQGHATVIEEEANRLHASLNLSDGPLMQVALFESGEDHPQRLLIIIHHLVIDGVSWRILLDDMQKAYWQIADGTPVKLGLKTTSFKDWSEGLTIYAQSEICKQSSRYWIEQAGKPVSRMPVDYAEGENTEESAETITEKLSERETKELLLDVTSAYHAQVREVLLAALLRTFAEWTATTTLAVDLEGHGREEIGEGINVARTVGWFTTIYPVVLQMHEAYDDRAALKSVKEQMRNIPDNGISFGVLKYLSGDKSIRDLKQPEISFNYLGQFDATLPQGSLFALAEGSTGTPHSLKGKRHHLLNVSALIRGDCMRIALTYSRNVHKESTVRSLMNVYVASLKALIAECHSPEADRYTPSDFPLLQVGQDELDKALGEVEFEG
jgi:non-ribosomal peptide synthase protein (TIGR01720 family)